MDRAGCSDAVAGRRTLFFFLTSEAGIGGARFFGEMPEIQKCDVTRQEEN